MEHKTSTATSGSGIQTNNEDNTLINYENTNHNFDETNHNDLFIRQPNFPIQSNINQPQYHHLANNQQSTLTGMLSFNHYFQSHTPCVFIYH